MSQQIKEALAALAEAEEATLKKLQERHEQERITTRTPFTVAGNALRLGCAHDKYHETVPHPHNGDTDFECDWCGASSPTLPIKRST